jgi:hypothetical protein
MTEDQRRAFAPLLSELGPMLETNGVRVHTWSSQRGMSGP